MERDVELPKAGELIGGRYRIQGVLGRGGMGVVFAAVNEATERLVAIKWMLPSAARSEESVSRFAAEARATARIEHPNVIEILDVGSDRGSPFLVMQHLRGESLGERLLHGPLHPVEAVDVLIAACRGIAEAHSEGVIHRDIKPDNIFLCRGKDGSPRPLKVLDFGVSKLYDDETGGNLTQTGMAVGTPNYMSPEQLNAPKVADGRFDVYAMGVVAYKCLTGRLPYEAEGLFALVQQISAGAPAPVRRLVPEIPEPLDAVVMQAMHARADYRYQTMMELVDALEEVRPIVESEVPIAVSEDGTPVPMVSRHSPVPVIAGLSPLPPSDRPPPMADAERPSSPGTVRFSPTPEDGRPASGSLAAYLPEDGDASRARDDDSARSSTPSTEEGRAFVVGVEHAPEDPSSADSHALGSRKRSGVFVLIGLGLLLGLGVMGGTGMLRGIGASPDEALSQVAPDCGPGLLDCNGDLNDGCETNIQADLGHCGACGTECAFTNASAECVAGACAIAVCDTGYADVNADPSDGCEGALATEVTLGDYHTCGLTSAGHVHCWGESEQAQAYSPHETLTRVSAGGEHTCGLTAEGTARCWGSNRHQQSTALAGSFQSLSAGGVHTCGLTTQGVVRCWGSTTHGQSLAPEESFTSVSAGSFHTCGVNAAGAIRCWGDNRAGQSRAPAGSFLSVSAGNEHTCGVSASGDVLCWGSDEAGQSSPPEGSFRGVSAGGFHSCGLLRDGSVRCWGNNDTGQSTPPAGTFARISAGLWHTCGINTEGQTRCWGANQNGQVRVPAALALLTGSDSSHDDAEVSP